MSRASEAILGPVELAHKMPAAVGASRPTVSVREGGDAATIEALVRLVAQLQLALESRVVIEQAKGMLAERYALSIDDAFDLLRGAARRHRVRIHKLAACVVVSSPSSPREVEAELPGGPG